MNEKKQYGKAVCWGVRHYPLLGIADVPEGVLRIKTRFRNNAVGVAYLWFKDRVEEWIMSPFQNGEMKPGETFDDSKQLWLLIKKGANARPAAKT